MAALVNPLVVHHLPAAARITAKLFVQDGPVTTHGIIGVVGSVWEPTELRQSHGKHSQKNDCQGCGIHDEEQTELAGPRLCSLIYTLLYLNQFVHLACAKCAESI